MMQSLAGLQRESGGAKHAWIVLETQDNLGSTGRGLDRVNGLRVRGFGLRE